MPQNILLPLILGLIGVVFALIGGGLTISARDFRKRAQRVQGEVVRLRPSRSSEGGTVYYPTVRFTTVYGQRVEAECPFGSSPPPAMPGDQVPILYDPAKPTRVRIDSATGSGTLIGVIFLGVGLVLFTAGVVVAAVM
ncbi:DUF3592 domain-containing protein [Planotetraspora sp. GP83]|uniref:DUF3592 domain-containing protein n=1 Tax=Planotetraspora sp. GP83 TaxID=3156264 RepID=UPI0035187BE6